VAVTVRPAREEEAFERVDGAQEVADE
jgi:hypothetical protein